MRTAAEVKPRVVRWLPGSHDRIPLGMLTEIAGRPGQGKSLYAIHLAAQVSHNADVLISNREDPEHERIRPRLEAAKANLDRVHIASLTLPGDLHELEEVVVQRRVKLIVIDPIAGHLGVGVSRFNDSIRCVSNPLAKIAEERNASALLVDHVIKHISPKAHPLQAIGGSGSGLVAAARGIYLVGKDPGDDERVLLCCVKPVEEKLRALAFTLDAVPYTEDSGREGRAGLLLPERGEKSELNFDARRLLVGEPGEKTGRPPSKREAAAEWLSNYLLGAEGHEAAAAEIEEDARQNGITHATLRRAAEDMVEKRQVKNADGKREWRWTLPQPVVEMLEKEGDGDGEA